MTKKEVTLMFLAEGLIALVLGIVLLVTMKKVLFPRKRGRHATVRVPATRRPNRDARIADEIWGQDNYDEGGWLPDEDGDENRPPLGDEEAVALKTTDDAAHSGSFPIRDEPGTVLFTPRTTRARVSDATTSFGVLRDGDTRTACEVFGHLFEHGKCRDCREDADNITWSSSSLANANRTQVDTAPALPEAAETAEAPDDPETMALPAAS